MTSRITINALLAHARMKHRGLPALGRGALQRLAWRPPKRPMAAFANTIELVPHVCDMRISTQSHIVGKVPPDVVGVVVDHNVVAVPQPVIAISVIECRNREKESTYRKSTAVAAVQSPHMPGTDGARKVAVLPRMIEVIVRIVATHIVPNPTVILRIDMR